MTTLSASRLDAILSPGIDADTIALRLGSLYGEATGDLGDRIVLYGAGPLGRHTLAGLRRTGVEPLAFVDGDPRRWGEAVDGLTVFSPKQALSCWATSVAFVVTVYNGTPVRELLEAEGCVAVASCPALHWKHAKTFIPFGGVCHPDATLNHSEKLRRAFALFEDDTSQEAFLGQLAWRLTLDYPSLPVPSPAAETYFPPEIVPVESEVFVDCGAFDGDSLETFFAHSPHGRAIALEPDPANAAALWERVRGIGRQDRVTVHAVAAASSSGTLAFDAIGTVASGFAEDGGTAVPCERLDDLLANEVPTYIKMDVEGAELDALKGATGTIRQHRPVLAVCLYHKPEDLWQIPLFIDSLNVDYKYALRVYAEECWEIVLYAIPAERWGA